MKKQTKSVKRVRKVKTRIIPENIMNRVREINKQIEREHYELRILPEKTKKSK